MPIASGAYPSPRALGLSASHEAKSAAEFFDAFPWDGSSDDDDGGMTSDEFFDAFCDEPPEPPAPSTLRGYQGDGRRGER